MARILWIAACAKHSLNLEFFHVLEFEEEDEDYAINKSTESYSSHNRNNVMEQWRRRINAQCGGLLEIKHERVEFLHRTVCDFLLTRELSDYLEQKSGQDFTVNLPMPKVFIFLFKKWVQSTDWLTPADEHLFGNKGSSLPMRHSMSRPNPRWSNLMLSRTCIRVLIATKNP